MENINLEKILKELQSSLADQQGEMEGAQAKIAKIKGKSSSPDKMVEVVVGSDGTVESIVFRNNRYRQKSPKQLGEILVEVLTEAREDAKEQVVTALPPFPIAGIDPLDAMNGNVDLKKVYDPSNFFPGGGDASREDS